MNEIDVIKGARAILASGRWHQGSLRNGDAGVCIIGALQETAAPNHWSDAYMLAAKDLAEHAPNHPGVRHDAWISLTLSEYNDASTTTLQDMLDLIDKTLADKGAL